MWVRGAVSGEVEIEISDGNARREVWREDERGEASGEGRWSAISEQSEGSREALEMVQSPSGHRVSTF
jgi:hypothetical protein